MNASAVRGHVGEVHADGDVTVHERARVLVAHARDYEYPQLDASVCVVSAGTSDAGLAAGARAGLVACAVGGS